MYLSINTYQNFRGMEDFNPLECSETGCDVYRRLCCAPFSYVPPGCDSSESPKVFNFGEVVEVALENSEKCITILSISNKFARHYKNSLIVWLSCGTLSSVLSHATYSQTNEGTLLMEMVRTGQLKHITIESLTELLGVLELLSLSIGNEKVLLVMEGLSALLHDPKSLHNSSAILFSQCLNSLYRLSSSHFVIGMWVSTYLQNKIGVYTGQHTTSPIKLHATNTNDSTSLFVQAWKNTICRVVSMPYN